MLDYLSLLLIVIVIFYFLLYDKSAIKKKCLSLPDLAKYKEKKKALNKVGELCCYNCSGRKIKVHSVKFKDKRRTVKKYYYQCKRCNVLLWRSDTK
ncbi:hypothetical protein PCNPT3_08110 [Psychromonas sp. CNPT3]|uniref:hypothetical protein n=1 Tax=Psychromonas sp. CNPT3 TaxID=314282 RepID=UPI00006E5368|nr:hypothetical protein [Psychromonas sp. CNPT3]AGH81560.1 hypothetical protein PCNPT3_08110 [Psychromonas sp. CNPT3]